MRNLILGRFGQLQEAMDLGWVFQNWVQQLLSMAFGAANIRYWRTTDQAEVDFVVEHSPHGPLLPVEVKYMTLKKPAVARSLQNFIAKYQPPKAWVINLSLSATVHIHATEVRFVSLAELLALP